MTPKLNSLLFQEYQYFLKRADGWEKEVSETMNFCSKLKWLVVE
jgi:hypothetical protein